MICPIHGVIIRLLAIHDDARGWLCELFRHDELNKEDYPVMAYVSMTRPGIVRGPHEHREQTDLFCFVGPSTFRLHLWDNRPDSPTGKEVFVGEFGEHAPALVLVPPGVVHAYKNIGECDGLVFNAPNRLYAGEKRSEPVDEVRHEDDPDSLFRIE